MFKKEYQGGSHVMVLTARGRDPTAHCKLTGNVSHRYDKVVKGYIHVFEGDSIATRLQLPASDRWTRAFLVVQASIEQDARFSIELGLMDSKGGRRRINFSTSIREPSISPLIARVPFVVMATGQWCNYCFELPTLVKELFPGHTHKSLESLVVGGACLLRRVFTLRERPRRGTDDIIGGDSAGADIPAACQMILDHTPIPIQMMSSVGGDGVAEHKTTAKKRARDGAVKSSDGPLTHMAFGQMVPIPDHVLSRQVSSRSAGNVRNKVRASGMSSRQSSAPQSSRREGMAMIEGVALSGQGHKVPRKQFQKPEKVTKQGESGGDRGSEETGKPLAIDELIALNALRLEDSGIRDLNSDFKLAKPLETVSVKCERRDGKIAVTLLDDRDHSHRASEREDGEDREREEELFSYFSPPKSAADSQTNSATASYSRDVKLEQDFLLNTSLHPNEQGLPRGSIQSDKEGEAEEEEHKYNNYKNSERDVIEVKDDVMEKGILSANGETRLSQDYDWRLYTSQDGTSPPLHLPSSSSSSPPHPTLLHLPTHLHGNSTTPEPDTSTLSMTEQPHPLLDTFDPRDMGGALSPLEPAADNHLIRPSDQEEDEELELMYDPQLHCFYDPNTHKYYELIQ